MDTGQRSAAESAVSLTLAMYDERAVLNGLGNQVFRQVCARATQAQWAEWLRAPLEHAAAAGNAELVGLLLRAGANGKAGWRGCHGRTFLGAAAQGGNHEVLAALLEAGGQAEVNVCSGEKMWSPLQYAASGGHATVARILMMEGAEADYVDLDQCGPLHLAALGGHEQMVCDLLLSGSPPNAKNDQGQTPLLCAAKQGHHQVIPALLLKGAEINTRDRQGQTSLHLAARNGHVSVTQSLLAAGADIGLLYVDDIFSWSALALAAENGHVCIIKELVKYGADVNFRATADYPALHWAAFHNHVAAIDILVEAGADIEARGGPTGRSPLHSAAGSTASVGCDAMVALLRHGAKVDSLTADGRTPLTMACQYLAEGPADLLLRWGADETSVDHKGQSAALLLGNRKQEGQDKIKAAERVRRLLSRAPADRTWRRRGLLVLCRAFPEKVQVSALKRHAAIGGVVQSDPEWVGVAQSAKTGEGLAHGAGQCAASDDGAGDERAGVLPCVEARVVALDQDAIFRTIVCFL